MSTRTAPTEGPTTLDTARQVADAVLYEGYVLYPYRASARKNQIRWQFGVVAPRPWAEAGGTEPWFLQTECLIDAPEGASVDVTLRAMHLCHRQVERVLPGGGFEPVDSLDAGGNLVVSWDEGEVREVASGPVELADLVSSTRTVAVPLAGREEVEPVGDDSGDDSGTTVGRVRRTAAPVAAALVVSAEAIDGPWTLVRLRVRVENTTPWAGGTRAGAGAGAGAGRDDAMRRALVGAHLLLSVDGGRFVSLLDPPEFAQAAVAGCSNRGLWPVLVGDEDRRNVILASPVTLYDFPTIAPESAGELCDSTEIDEILTLRVLTLTDEEKREARSTDPRAAAIVERADSMPPEMLDRLHGAIRYLRGAQGPGAGPGAGSGTKATPATPGATDPSEVPPWWDPGADASVDPENDTVRVGDTDVGRGTEVTLQPLGRADAQDLFLVGRRARIEAVFLDVDGGTHLAVTLTDDPAADLARWHGRYLYFRPEEVHL